MSKVNQIQQALLEMDGGQFQKLADAYLTEKGFGRVNAIGSVVAANKVKPGTPDTLITNPKSNYIFAEHTTQKKGLLGKMKDDLGKCFDESKTGVPVEKIELVVFCFTGKLDAEEVNELIATCQERGVDLDLFGIDALTFDLYSKYPALARDFLGISIDTGQILPPEQFVTLYNSNKLATRLDHGFHFREKELNSLGEALKDEMLIILSGQAGVGKSRLALEACAKFSGEHSHYEVQCVLGRNRDLWEDLKVRFTKPGHFLIFVDDANRVSQFEYVVDLLQHQRDDQQIKVIATVRDYAAAKVVDEAQPAGSPVVIELNPFTDEQIKGLVTDEYGIDNHSYLRRIAEIAHGNPRLAVMAAEVAKDEPPSCINDVSSLYDRYFSSIRKDLIGEGADPGSADLLRVAAIVSFFKAVDRTNDEMMNVIMEAFGITPAVFWEAADRLHEMEMLDMYEGEVARVSDQVLSTYLFYLAVFKENVLNFGALLTHFFPKLRNRMIDSINPILNAFDHERITKEMLPHVEQAWTLLEEKDDKRDFLHLLDVFWFTKQTDTLLWVQDRIDEMKPEPVEITGITFEKNSHAVHSPSILSVLRSFAHAEDDVVQMALDLLSCYLDKRPAEAPILLSVLIDDYGFREDSHSRRFEVQRAVVDELWDKAKNGNYLFSRVFLAVTSNYLCTHFTNQKMRSESELQLTSFKLCMTQDLLSIREAIWKRLFDLYDYKCLQDHVLTAIHHYSKSYFKIADEKVAKSDTEQILPFLKSKLDPKSYLHCTIWHDYLNFLAIQGIEISENLVRRFRNDTYALAEILLPEWGEQCLLDSSHKEHEEYEDYERCKRERLEGYTKNYTLENFKHFLKRCIEIKETPTAKGKDHKLTWGVVNVLLMLADREPELYHLALMYCLQQGYPLHPDGNALVQKLVEQQGCNKTFQILGEPDYPKKNRWLFHVHEILPGNCVDEWTLEHLYELYITAERAELPYDLDYLLKFLPLDPRVVAGIVSKVLKKCKENSSFAHTLKMLFHPSAEVAKRLTELFAEDLDLLKCAYLVIDDTEKHLDPRGRFFNLVLDLDPNFITDYLTFKYTQANHRDLSSHDNRDYAFIWDRPDYQDIMNRVVKFFYNLQQHRFSPIPPLKMFFQTGNLGKAPNKKQKKQEDFLLRLIDKQSNNEDFVRHLFSVIAHLPPSNRSIFVKRFIQRNRGFEAFKCLPLEPTSWSWTDSILPILEGRVKFWDSLLPIMKTVDLLRHRQYVEKKIHELRADIERVKKNDFIGD